MERIEYDPEIDPSIREEREAAERERELVGRIRLEIERYVEENDLVPRKEPADEGANDERQTSEGTEEKEEKEEITEKEIKKQARAELREERSGRREEKRARRRAERGKTVKSVFSGSILSSEQMRRMWPWLLGLAVLMVLYIAGTFHLQKLQLERGHLEKEVRELGVKAMERTAERVRETRRSAIVERLAEKNIPLKEFPHPVKKIER